jgi:ferrochelatase
MTDTRNGKLGVLLTNLGTPDAPTAPALRRYLAEFLSDPEVVTLPKLLWLPVLHLLILRTRPAKSAKAYERIWTPEGSPLLVNSRNLARKLERALRVQFGDSLSLALGMRYGQPSLSSAIASLKGQGISRLLVLPLYPQYAGATTGSTEKAVTRVLRDVHWSPAVKFLDHYHELPAYIAALSQSVREYWTANGRGEKLLISFHGIPKAVADRGDPYAAQCAATARLLAEQLKLQDGEWQLVFQSRFGPAEWLQPYTEDTLKALAKNGLRRVDVICPGFAADCLETLEEIALRYAASFEQAGGQGLHYIPALNDGDTQVRALGELVINGLSAWGVY